MGRTDLSGINKAKEIYKELPDSLGGTIKAHRDRLHITQKVLAEYTLLSVDTISRIETGESDEPNLETLMAIIVGLRLDYRFSFDILYKSGDFVKFYTHKTKEKYLAYQEIIAFEGKYSVREVNQMLKDKGIRPFTISDE